MEKNKNNDFEVDDNNLSKESIDLQSTEDIKIKRKIRKQKRQKKLKILKEKNTNSKTFFQKLKGFWPLSKVSGKILSIYFLTFIIGGLLLSIPGVVINEKYNWNFINGLFNASSAVSDTGITVLSPSSDYSFIGQFLILIMIQIGGIGILTLKITIYIILGKKISVNDQSIAQSERGSSVFSTTVEMIKDGFIFLTIIEVLGASILFFGFYFSVPEESIADDTINKVINTHNNFEKSLWAAIFHSVSAVNNAGFDIISNKSLLPYNGSNPSYILQLTFLCQWVIGGLGYPTFNDIKKKIKSRSQGKKVKFSLFTKLNFIVYSILFIAGPLTVFISESISWNQSNIINYNNGSTKNSVRIFMDIFFNVSASRNAGFSTVDINNFNDGSKLIISTLMFIGSAPSSTAGGIRTTTTAIIFVAIWSIIRNKKSVNAFKRKIPADTVKRSFAVLALSMFLVFFGVLILFLDLPNDIKNDGSIIKIILLVCSAFGTVGFDSMGNLVEFNILSKLVLIFIMFLGQLGISNTLLAFIKPNNKDNFEYLEEDVVIG